MKKMVSALLVGASMMAAAPASAATIVETAGSGALIPDLFEGFDTSLGTLTSVTVSAFIRTFGQVGRPPTTGMPATNTPVTFQLGLDVYQGGASNPAPGFTLIAPFSVEGAVTFDQGASSGGCNASGSSTATFTTNLNLFSRGSTPRLVVFSNGSGCSSLPNYTMSGGSFSSATITYNYEPTAAAVPEPATWAMMLTGFIAVGAVIRRRKPACLARAS